MCLEALHLNIFMIQTFCTVMHLFKGSCFSVGAASSHFRPNSAFAQTQTVQCTYFIVYEFCFTCLNVGYKRLYILQGSSIETITDI